MASEVKTNKISPSTSTTVTLGDASDLFQLPASAEIDIASGATLDVNGNIDFTGATVTGLTTGKVLQVVQAVKTDTTSTTDHSGSFVDITGMTVDITPSATASKVFVLFSLVVSTATTNRMLNVRLLRDAVTPILGDTAGSRIRISTTTITARVATMVPLGMEYLDSPSTTSAVTYKLQWSLQQAGTGYLNRAGTDTDDNTHARGASTITVMEIGA
tara:strand:- start:189 stop:836 length:648 start_codon:yes stop_codon:yes gene_type:complete